VKGADRFRAIRLCAALGLAGWAGVLHAQTPAAGNPLSQLPSTQPVPLAPGATPGAHVTVQAPPDASAARMAQVVRPTRFDIEGVNAIPFEEVASRFAPLAGQPVSVAQLVAVAGAATALYRERGHPLSFVFVPEQDFANGVVRVVAVEGFVSAVRIEGDAGNAEPMLRAIAERLTTQRPLTQRGFERVTQLLARLPGLTVDANAALPGGTDGATTLVLKVKREPYNLSVGVDLRQPTPRAVLTGVWNDPVASGSQLNASTLLGNYRNEKLLTLGYTQMLSTDGLAFKANVSSYRGYPDEAMGRGASIERFNTNRRVDLSLSYPLMLTARSSLTLSGGFYAVDNIDTYRSPASGNQLSEDTRIRALFAQLAYADNQPDRGRSASVMLAQGLRGAGASATNYSNVPGLAGSNPAQLDFTRVTLDASQRDRYANKMGTAVAFGAQYSGQTLAASERISFGGARFGRGYAMGDGSGDSGWGVSAELNRLFVMESQWLKQIEPYLLLEAADVSMRQGQPTPSKLRSAALGMRFSDNRHYSLDLALAKPTGDAAPSNPARKPRLSLLLTYQLAAR
jgi:hemolysin activation/secretion protein